MRFVYSAAAALVAVFAASVATSTSADANALLESDVSLVGRVTDGNAYDVDTQRLLRESFDDDESSLLVEWEERANNAVVATEAASVAETAAKKIGLWARGVDKGLDYTVAASNRLASFNEKYKVLGKPIKWWSSLFKWLSGKSLLQKFLKKFKDIKIEDSTIGDRFEASVKRHKKVLVVTEDAGTAETAGATRAVDPNGVANAGGRPTTAELNPLAMKNVARAAAGDADLITKKVQDLHQEGYRMIAKAWETGKYQMVGPEKIKAFETGCMNTINQLADLEKAVTNKLKEADDGAIKSAWDLIDNWRPDFVNHVENNVLRALRTVNDNKEVKAIREEIKTFVDNLPHRKLDELETKKNFRDV
ncbi:unnamed protein product [Hyaloperonospora brassicae]|uniref:RxLR effector protein n=1 Tax=Hyaloperonospora brassicae TaxID=162125 RepID=A0AAV0T425_HYABA|nr:unnamed protein product [Hyaloperonospora brassicae]